MNIGSSTLLGLLVANSKQHDIKTNTSEGVKKDSPSLVAEKKTTSDIKNLKILLDALFNKSISEPEKRSEVARTLENNRGLFQVKSFQQDLKELVKLLNSKAGFEANSIQLKNFMLDLNSLDPKKIEKKIQNSGILYESKLALMNMSNNKAEENIQTNIKNLQKLIVFKEEFESLKFVLSKYNPKEQMDIKDQVLQKTDNVLKYISSFEPQGPQQKDISLKAKVLIDSLVQGILKNDFTQHSNKIEIFLQDFQKIITDKVLSNQSLLISQDLKYILMQTLDEVDKLSNESDEKGVVQIKQNIEKSLTTIEYFQHLSFSTNSQTTFLPFIWEELEDGQIKFNIDKDKTTTCQIDLELKMYGKLKIYLILDEKKNIQIDLGIQNEEFYSLINKNMQELRQKIYSIGLNISNINLFDLKRLQNSDLDQFENFQSLNFGLDIKV